MYLKQVTLTNVRSFHGKRRVDLDLTRPDGSYAGWTVIAGRNGSGKTTLLRAIALAATGPDIARALVPGFENWISSEAPGATAKVTLAVADAFDDTTGPANDSRLVKAGLGWVWREPSHNRRGAGTKARQPSLRPVTGGTSLDVLRAGPWSEAPVGWFCAGYGPFRRLAGGSGEVERLMRMSGPVSRLTSLFHEDASLAEGVSWLIAQHLYALENREGAQALKDLALTILGDDLLPDDFHIDGVDSDGLWVVNGEHRFPLREMSDGYRTVAALVVDLIKQLHDAYGELTLDASAGNPALAYPGIVMIDEVDTHLHVTWQKRIGGWLTAHFPGIQFIVTTHSPYVCQAADPGGLIRLPAPDEEHPAEVVSEDLYQRVVYGSGDDAVLSDLFGLDSAYSERAEEARDELVALEADVLGGTASETERGRYRALAQLLTSSPAARVQEIDALLHGWDAQDS